MLGYWSLKNILSSCYTAPEDGRYRWRHDQILKEIVAVVNTAISRNIPNYEKSLIRFIRAGEKSKPKEKSTTNALSLATNWELRADLETRWKFPDHIAQISLRPDISIFSNKIKKNNTGIDSSIGETRRRGPWMEEIQIWWTPRDMQIYWMECMLYANRGLFKGVRSKCHYARPCQTLAWQESEKGKPWKPLLILRREQPNGYG